MTRLYIIRHAEAEGNLYRIAQGQYDSILTDRGWQQVAALERRFADIPVDAVYSSDLYRTCATASAIYKPKNLPLHKRRDLREIYMGAWEQKTWGEIAREEPEQLAYFTHELHLWHTEGAETVEQVRNRILAAVREIARENEGKTVAVFSHGCAIRLLLAHLQGYTVEELGKTPHSDNTAVSLLEAEGDGLRVIYRDDNSHLRGLAAPGRRANALEPGLYFEPLRLPEQADFLVRCVSTAWADSGDDRPWDPETLLDTAARRPTLVGVLNGEPVSLIQLHPEKEAAEGCGWLSLYCVGSPWRGKGYGVQLMGQAVQYYRPLGRRCLRLALTENNGDARKFFSDYGFRTVGQTAAGREIWEKEIGYNAEFLN